MARAIRVELVCISTPLQAMYRSALPTGERSRSRRSRPVSSRTRSGPFVQSRTKSRSMASRSIITPAIPSARAPSVPGRTPSHTSAFAAGPTRRGSTTMSRAPRVSASVVATAWERRARFGL